MLRFLILRVISAVPILAVLSVVTFLIIHAQPGDYGDYLASMMVNRGGASIEAANAAAEAYRVAHGLKDPLIIQYFRWIWGIFTRFDFGDSLLYNKPVSQIIAQRLPPTIMLALTCHLLATGIGITLGIVAATRQYSWVDTLFGAIAFLGMTIPRFLVALIIIYILAFRLNVQEIGSFFSAKYGGAPWSIDKFIDLMKHIWPVIFIATFGGLAYNMRVMRANLLDVLNLQYVETARAKGLSNAAVVLRHAVPNALHPLVAYQGVSLPYMLTGEIEVAVVFGLATVGPSIVASMAVGDVWVTATLVLVLAVTLIIGNILSDLLLAVLDPRIRLGGAA